MPFAGLFCSAFAGVDRSGRGCNPRPAQGRPAQGRLSGEGSKLPFAGLFCSAFAGVDRSGRGFNPRPAQGWGAQGCLSSEGSKLPFFWALLICFRGGGSFRLGVQPPTGSRGTGSRGTGIVFFGGGVGGGFGGWCIIWGKEQDFDSERTRMCAEMDGGRDAIPRGSARACRRRRSSQPALAHSDSNAPPEKPPSSEPPPASTTPIWNSATGAKTRERSQATRAAATSFTITWAQPNPNARPTRMLDSSRPARTREKLNAETTGKPHARRGKFTPPRCMPARRVRRTSR